MKRFVVPIAFATLVSFVSASGADARSCTDALQACLKIYDVTRGGQMRGDPRAACTGYYNSCMQTGVWASPTKNFKGLEKK